VRSLASAARLLAKCTSVHETGALIREIGFLSNLVPLAADGIKLLGLPEGLTSPHIVSGHGSLRALVFEIAPGSDEQATLSRLALILSSRAPQLLFILVAVHRSARTLSVAAFDTARLRPRVSSLMVRIDAVVDSDAETVCNLAAAVTDSDIVTHCRWLEILGRESIGRKFFRDLERVVASLAISLTPRAPNDEAAELALLYVSRLLFLSFLETKGWLNRDHAFLANQFASCMMAGGGYHRQVLSPLFFGTLNTSPANRAKRAREFGRIPFLNGGLFNKSRLEIRTSSSRFSDEALGQVFGDLLTRYRFTAREDGTSWTQAAIDPEMLGKAFECLMSAHDRKTSGAFYTPQLLVREVSRAALSYGIVADDIDHDTVRNTILGSLPSAPVRTLLLKEIDRARVLDPACGSGAFLVHVLEELSILRTRLGDLRPPHVIRRDVLARSIFGVDINPMAVWLCELRLWLCMAIDDPERDPLAVAPLPNLDRNIRVGDSLSGDAFAGEKMRHAGSRLAALRMRYSRATGPRKKSLAKSLDAFERECALSSLGHRISRLNHERRELIVLVRSPDLFGVRSHASVETSSRLALIRKQIAFTRRDIRRLADGGALPFSFPSGFADAAADGGFSIIVGNPPWLRTHNLDATGRAALRERFEVYRKSAWIDGSDASGAGKGFASQVDAAALFVERCTDLLKSGGTMSLILPVKLWRSLSGGGVRQLLLKRTSLREVHDLTGAPNVFDAAVYPSILVSSRSVENSVSVSAHKPRGVVRWCVSQRQLSFDESQGSPWILAPRCVRSAFEKVRGRGVAMSSSRIGRPLLGVKTGCNEAFIVSESADVEPHLLRRVVRGDQVHRWSIDYADSRIIWTHDRDGPLRDLPPLAARWLRPWRAKLEQRSDAQRTHRWWSLFRTEAADSNLPRVVWADIGKDPRAAVIDAGDDSVPLNTCYVARCPELADAFALTAILNSPLAGSWLSLIAEPARGGYMRYMGWTMSLFPLPSDWNRARNALTPIGEQAASGTMPNDDELLAAVLDSYRLTMNDVNDLLSWGR
jgi:hypothetical protein